MANEFFRKFTLQKNCNQYYSSNKNWGLTKMTLGLVDAGCGLPEWQTVKLTSFPLWSLNFLQLPFVNKALQRLQSFWWIHLPVYRLQDFHSGENKQQNDVKDDLRNNSWKVKRYSLNHWNNTVTSPQQATSLSAQINTNKFPYNSVHNKLLFW